uniref:B30.2/SPRY domain-containing protein n=1 Tax=Cyprinus carpio TaxID=7962 RepID=A0A8C1SQY1_CYPCA
FILSAFFTVLISRIRIIIVIIILSVLFRSKSPVILDPNTAHPSLVLSDDLTSVRCNLFSELHPDNPERFDIYPCVLGSEGFNSGTHSWDVEVDERSSWSVGVTTASKQRKGRVFFNTDVWSVQCGPFQLPGFHVKQKLECVRVYLDYDRGTVSFSDPATNTHLHTFTTTFSDTVFYRSIVSKCYTCRQDHTQGFINTEVQELRIYLLKKKKKKKFYICAF